MSKKDEDIRETKLHVALRANYHCEKCGKSQPIGKGEMAHGIGQGDEWIKKYTAGVVHHPLNLHWTCPGACNASFDLQNEPVARDELAYEIRLYIYAEATARMEITPHLYRPMIDKLAKIARGE